MVSSRTRWLDYMRESIIEATVSNDVLQMESVRKPMLLKRAFEYGSLYSSQEISYRKLLGQLDDKGNTETIAHYIDLLDRAGMLAGLQKYDSKRLRSARSSPKLLVYDTAFMTYAWHEDADKLLTDPELKGRLVESAVGASLLGRSKKEGFELFWWRDGNDEVDFVVQQGENLTAIEVKSGRMKNSRGIERFKTLFPNAKILIVGGPVYSLEDFLLENVKLF